MSQLHDTLVQILTAKSDIEDRFVDIQRLPHSSGYGTFSLILTAYDRLTDQRVAVKVCLPNQERYRAASFEREASILALLRTAPDIVQLIADMSRFSEPLTHSTGISFDLSLKYYALELATTDIRAILTEGDSQLDRLLVIFRSMCRAVQRIHSQRIAHRDLKPSNFLLMPDGSVRLTDFGTATRLVPDTPPLLQYYTGPPGDCRYCAPEMLACLHEEQPDIAFRADLFSLGAILFEICTGNILATRLFNSQFWEPFTNTMTAISPAQRRRQYDRIVSGLANARPLPSLASFGSEVPKSVSDRLDDLYQGLAAIDYRRRLSRFDRIFNQINTCLLILNHESKYQHWLVQRQRRRARRAERALAVPS